MTDWYLYVADFCIISHEIPLPNEDTQIRRNKQFYTKYFFVRPLFYSFRFIFLSQLMPLSFVPFFTSVLCCQPQRVGYRPLPREGTVRIQASGGESGTGTDFFRAQAFFPASIISPMFPLHITFYSSCYKSSLISRSAPSFSHYMQTTAKYQ